MLFVAHSFDVFFSIAAMTAIANSRK